MFKTANDFFVHGFHEMIGLNWDQSTKTYQGWGFGGIKSINNLSGASGAHFKPYNLMGLDLPLDRAASVGGSMAQGFMGPVFSAVTGFIEGGFPGAAKWLTAEFFQSSFVSAASRSGGAWAGRYGLSIAGSMVGSMMGPEGMVAGSALGSAPAWAAGLLLAPGALTFGGAYLAGKGTLAIMKQGYYHEQMRNRSVDYAGSTASFMTKQAATMRGRAVKAINMHQLNARSALGQEANLNSFNSYRKLR